MMECYTGCVLPVKEAMGHRSTSRQAKVVIEVGGHTISTTALTCPSKELGGAALLAVAVTDRVSYLK